MEEDLKVQLRIGDIVDANVILVKKAYAKMSVGDVVAVMPASEFSWSKSRKMHSNVTVGDSLRTVVIAMKDGVAMLSAKRLKPDPWERVDEYYQFGMKVKGTIINIVSFGAFIELDDGITGLLHRKQIVNDAKVDLKTILTEGEHIEVNIVSVDKAERKVSFSMI